jgi:hypothetical protein
MQRCDQNVLHTGPPQGHPLLCGQETLCKRTIQRTDSQHPGSEPVESGRYRPRGRRRFLTIARLCLQYQLAPRRHAPDPDDLR